MLSCSYLAVIRRPISYLGGKGLTQWRFRNKCCKNEPFENWTRNKMHAVIIIPIPAITRVKCWESQQLAVVGGEWAKIIFRVAFKSFRFEGGVCISDRCVESLPKFWLIRSQCGKSLFSNWESVFIATKIVGIRKHALVIVRCCHWN